MIKSKVFTVWRGGVLIRIFDNKAAAELLKQTAINNGVKDTMIVAEWPIFSEYVPR